MGILRNNFKKPEIVQKHERGLLIKGANIGVKYPIGSKREDVQSRIFRIASSGRNCNM